MRKTIVLPPTVRSLDGRDYAVAVLVGRDGTAVLVEAGQVVDELSAIAASSVRGATRAKADLVAVAEDAEVAQ